jgi:pimeloyl-ACP methyl ester carboxylesterase
MNYPNWLNKELYPFEGNTFQTSNGKMHYLDEGSGEVVLLVHGNPGWSFEFREVIKQISDKKRVIAPDHIGFGLSDKPHYTKFDYMPQRHAENLAELIDHLDLQNITIVINDWGGPIGLNYALKHPEKFKKIVVLNSWLWSVKGDKHFERFSGFMGGGIGKFLIRNFNFFAKGVVKKAVINKSILTKEIKAHFANPLSTADERMPSHIFPREIIGSSDWLEAMWDQRNKLKNIPAAFVWGEKDIAFRENELLKWQELWPDAPVTKLPNVGHYPQEEAPDAVVASILAE